MILTVLLSVALAMGLLVALVRLVVVWREVRRVRGVERPRPSIADLERWHAAWERWQADDYPDHGSDYRMVQSDDAVDREVLSPGQMRLRLGCECRECRSRRAELEVRSSYPRPRFSPGGHIPAQPGPWTRRWLNGDVVGVDFWQRQHGCAHESTVDLVVMDHAEPVRTLCSSCGADVETRDDPERTLTRDRRRNHDPANSCALGR